MIPIKNRKGLETIINELRKFAHSYLDKYSPSKQQLRTYLLKKILKKDMRASNKKELLNLIDIVVVDLEDQKFVSDKFYSDSKSRSFLKKGYSLNKIRYSLIKKGIDEKYIKGSILKIKNDKELDVSTICLGTMTWGEQNTEEEAHQQLDYAIKDELEP